MKARVEPMRLVNCWRFLSLAFLVFLWAGGDSLSTSAFILVLLLVLLSSLRWRFRLPWWSAALDAFVCFLYFPYTALGYYGLALPIFELTLRGRPFFALLLFISLLAAPFSPVWLFWHFALALFVGLFSHVSLQTQHSYQQEADEQRKAKYELERVQAELLTASRAVAQQAELMERHRIARQLHDHLGHDLTGAALALQAYAYIQEPEEARKLLQEVKLRLERSATSLRETVHNETPTARIGVEHLEYAARNFRQADIRFQKSGDVLLVPAYHWGLLEACLKEALTNVARHSNATQVDVQVHATESITRLLVQDNGTTRPQQQAGSGLRSLQLRARALGGSLAVSGDNGFLLVCVLPRTDEHDGRQPPLV